MQNHAVSSMLLSLPEAFTMWGTIFGSVPVILTEKNIFFFFSQRLKKKSQVVCRSCCFSPWVCSGKNHVEIVLSVVFIDLGRYSIHYCFYSIICAVGIYKKEEKNCKRLTMKI